MKLILALSSTDEQQRIVAYLDGLPPIGDASQQAKVHPVHRP
jgi:hypothetical protein